MSGDHDHGDERGTNGFTRAFAVGIALKPAFVAVEAFYGWRVNSLALLADAGHNLSDVAGLVLGLGGALAGRLRPDARVDRRRTRECHAPVGGDGGACVGGHRPGCALLW